MALTKVKLISDGVITVDNLNENHGITTTHIGEGDKLFYTDARVQSYLSANNYATIDGGYFTNATLSANILTFDKSDGTTDSVDLSLYLDDTNLARLVSGTLDALTGIATFTRDDSSTFTIDFSAFLSDANDYVSSGSFNTATGVLTLTRLGGATVTIDLDGKYAESVHTHIWTNITDRPTALSSFTNDLGNYGGFLTSFTETDPIYTASSWYSTTNNANNWNTAYGWGNHASAGYLTSFTETDPIYTASSWYTTTNNSTNWNTAYGWGNHAGLYSLVGHTHDLIRHSLAAPAFIDSMTSTSFRTSLFGSNTDGYAISTSRWNTTPTALSGMNSYGTLFAWSGSDTHGFIATDYNSANIQVGGGYGDNITWKATLIHSGNIGSQSVASATTSSTTTHLSARTDSAWYNVVWAAGNPSHLYSADAVQIQSNIGAIRANIFYDSNNTNYYTDPASTSVLNNITFGSSTNGGTLSGNGDWGMRLTTSSGYIQFGPANSGWAHMYSNLNFYMNTGLWISGGYMVPAYGLNGLASPLYASIFYDASDTTYYVDPNSTSNLNYLDIGNTREEFPLLRMGADGRYAIGVSGAYTRISAHPLGSGVQLGHWDGTTFVYKFTATNAGDATAEGSSRAPIFYDSDDTGYYIDPASTSNTNDFRAAAYRGNANVGGTGTATWHPDGVYCGSTMWQYGSMYKDNSGIYDLGEIKLYNGPYLQTYNSRSLIIRAQDAADCGISGRRSDGGFAFQIYGDASNYGFLGYEWGDWDIRKTPNGRMYLNADNSYYLQTDGDSYVYRMMAATDMRAPIFYDSNDTNFYLDPASSSRINTIYFDTLRNPSGNWILGQQGTNYFSFGSSAVADTVDFDVTYITQKSIITLTDDSYYKGSPSYGFRFNNNADSINALIVDNSGNSIAYSSHRAPVFYDSNDTGYYLDPTSTTSIRTVGSWRANSSDWDGEFAGKIQYHANTWYFQAANGWFFRNAGSYDVFTVDQGGNTTTSGYIRINANTNLYLDANYGQSIVGLYDSFRYQGIFAMGDAYKLSIDGTTPGNLYGLAWSHPNAGGVASNLNTHGLLVMENGSFLAAISGSIRARDDMRAPIFYDYNDTSFYLDPNGTSELSQITIGTRARWGEPIRWTNRQAYSSSTDYWTGTNGWGTAEGTWDTAWKGGFSGWDIWGSDTGHPQGSGYVHAQGIVSGQHAATDGGAGYGWMMVGAGDATPNRYWLRGKWGSSTSGWVEMYHTGNMDAPNKSGTSYYQTNTWMQMNGDHGLWWPNYYGAHFYPNNNWTHGQFRIDGSKNGYGGIVVAHAGVNGMMYDADGNGGIYREANGWYLYHHVGNNCTSINTSTGSSAYGMYVDKAIYSTGDIIAYSDRRKKTDIVTIENALDKVKEMRGVFYTKIGEEEKGRKVGVIAQEMNEVLPEVVTYAEDIDEYGVAYGNIVGVLIEAIKEQQKQIDELKAIINGTT